MELTELKELLRSIESNRLFNVINKVKVSYNSKYKTFKVSYNTNRHLSPPDFLQLKRSLNTYSTGNIFITVSQSNFINELLSDSLLFEKYSRDICVAIKPDLFSLIQNVDISVSNAGKINFSFRDGNQKKLFDEMELEEHIQNYFFSVYSYNICVSMEDINQQFINKKDIPSAIKSGTLDSSNVQKIRLKTASRGKSLKEPEKLSDLILGHNCQVVGEVLSCEKILLKNGEFTKYKFILFDYTSTVMCFYIEGKHAKKRLANPQKGDWIYLEGLYDRHQYETESAIKVTVIQPFTRIVRSDDMQEKRVELHAHTKMSAQDGVSSAKDIIKRALDWGHKAIAITDHGVIQAFPEAYKAAQDKDIKVIYGIEGYMFDDKKAIFESEYDACFNDEYIVFDIETTGLNPFNCDITEIGAVRIKDKKIIGEFQTFVKPSHPIPKKIVDLTGITDEMVKDAPTSEEALRAFRNFCGENTILAAHNSDFDTQFIFNNSEKYGILYDNPVIDTVDICRVAWPNLKNYKLDTIANVLCLNLNHHHALDDAKCTGQILLEAFSLFQNRGLNSLMELNAASLKKADFKHARTYHIILLAKNKEGLKNLYKLISRSHIDYFYRKPRMPKSVIEEYRNGLIIGSACEAGELYKSIIRGSNSNKLKSIASFYDYLEIQPAANNAFMIKKGIVNNLEEVRAFNTQVVKIGDELNKPVVATCDVHFIDAHEAIYREIIQYNQKGFKPSEEPPTPLYLRTTREMIEEFTYLGAKKAYEVVVTNTNKIADSIERIELFDSKTAMPVIENAAEFITELAYKTAKSMYGDVLPHQVEERLSRELDSIVSNEFSVLYYSAHKIVKKSLDDGYLVGSRGSVGSSLAATMMGITEVNPLPPHYLCPNCKHSDFKVDVLKYTCGPDLPDAECPVCGAAYVKDGYDIPFEVFLGINANKVPDIDLNFSGEYQNKAHKYTEEMFGKEYVFRAGTINGLKERSAESYVRNYFESINKTVSEAEVKRLKDGITGVKKTTGQHPGGMVIVPRGREIYEFTPIQRPADKQDARFITTHFDFESMHDILVKLDILAHDAPTIMRIIQNFTGLNPVKIPLNDKKVVKLFSSLEPLSIASGDLLGIKVGTLGIPEFGTKFVRQMLMDTLPTTIEEIIRISGLSHGTDVWLSNAQDLIKAGTCTLKEVICTRDDILNYMVANGADKRIAFKIMEKVRKGKAGKEGFTQEEEQAFIDAHMPEWFKNSCLKIAYMFPKAHAVAYCIMSLRIAYCKIYHKEAFYASYFTVRANEFDKSLLYADIDEIKNKWLEIQALGKSASIINQKLQSMLEVVCEMRLRGINFLPVDLNKSDARTFKVENDGLRLPFLSIDQLGETVADTIIKERSKYPFLSAEDLKKRCKISSAAMEILRDMGTLNGLRDTNQLSLFGT